jgi:hypothetical protein
MGAFLIFETSKPVFRKDCSYRKIHFIKLSWGSFLHSKLLESGPFFNAKSTGTYCTNGHNLLDLEYGVRGFALCGCILSTGSVPDRRGLVYSESYPTL